MRVTLGFDKPAYDASEYITAQLTVVNTGPATATRVRAQTSGNLYCWWGDLSMTGVTLAPGETFTATSRGLLDSLDEDSQVRITVTVSADQQDADPADNVVTATAAVTVHYGNYSGTVYGDRNRNGVLDAGEALDGVLVDAYGGRPYSGSQRRTDASGRFSFQDLRIGDYRVSFRLDGWLPEYRDVTIDGVHDVEASVGLVRPLASVLAVSMTFDRPSYAIGDQARLTVTLTNSDFGPLSGITATCYPADTSGPEWGGLAPGGPGLTIPARSSVRIEPTLAITQNEYNDGAIVLEGTFRRWNSPLDWPVYASASALVPGGIAAVSAGQLRQIDSTYLPMGMPVSRPLPGVTVYLTSENGSAVVARSVTDADGIFSFRSVPAGWYQFGVVGPWQIAYSRGEYHVRADEHGDWRRHVFLVAPGPYQPDPDPAPTPVPTSHPAAPPAAAAPQGTAGTRPGGLAGTGANVLWLAAGGLLSLIAGAYLVRRLRPGRFGG